MTPEQGSQDLSDTREGTKGVSPDPTKLNGFRPQADDAGRRERYARIAAQAMNMVLAGVSAPGRIDPAGEGALYVADLLIASDPQPAVVDAEVVARLHNDVARLQASTGYLAHFGTPRALDAGRWNKDFAADILALLNTGGRGDLVGHSHSASLRLLEDPMPNARWRCTRCGENDINARANGCKRGPCPMEFVG